jgi:Flp pilus assembly protein TadG
MPKRNQVSRRSSCRGSTVVEFALAGIPLLFILISIFELSRGLWIYHSLGYAVREGVRYASFHGKGCAFPKTCSVTVGQIAAVIQSAGLLDQDAVTMTLTTATGGTTSGTMSSQLASTTVWPPSGANTPGQHVKIAVKYPYQSFLGILWNGASGSQTIYLSASSSEPIQF